MKPESRGGNAHGKGNHHQQDNAHGTQAFRFFCGTNIIVKCQFHLVSGHE
jgi:hypothetical protein